MKRLMILCLVIVSTQLSHGIELTKNSQTLSHDFQRILGELSKSGIMKDLQEPESYPATCGVFPFANGKFIEITYGGKTYTLNKLSFSTYAQNSSEGQHNETTTYKGMSKATSLSELKEMLKDRLPLALTLTATLAVENDYMNVTSFLFKFRKESGGNGYGDCDFTFYGTQKVTMTKDAEDFFSSF